MFPFIPNWIHWDNIIPDQSPPQLMKYINCILFHVIDTIIPFIPNWIERDNFIPDQLLPQPIDEVHQLHPIPCNWYHCFLSPFPIELKKIISFQISCSSNCWGSPSWIASYCFLWFSIELNEILSFRHSRSIAPPPIDEVHELHPIPCNWYHCFLWFPIELKEIISFQNNCSPNWWSTSIASYSM